MPLYPYCAGLNFINNYLVSGLIVQNLCCVLAYLFHGLALMDTDKKGALRALKYLCILPASFLFSAPLSDSLFLLLSVACVYAVRKIFIPLPESPVLSGIHAHAGCAALCARLF
ncbi:MAG: hypothetical protein R2912_07610 [Eubacteriales bacterium]